MHLRLFAAACAVAMIAGCSSSGGTGTTTPPPTSPTPTPTSTGDFARAQAWFAGVQQDYTAIQQSTEAISQAAGKKDLGALKTLCQALQTNVATARSDPAPPDPRMKVAVATSLEAYAEGASRCLAGDYGGAADDLNKGAQYLQEANAIMNNMQN